MKVAKFGGSSLATAAQVRKVCSIIAADPDRRLVVVSAPGRRAPDDEKVTDLLILAARERLAGRSGEALIEQVIERYAQIARGMALQEGAVRPIAEDLRGRLASDLRPPDRYMDLMKAGGEDNSARLIATAVRGCGVEARYVSPREAGLYLSDEAGNARVLDRSYAALHELRNAPGVTIFPGFFGHAEAGHVVTFPRGGSDITGAILAAAVEADVYENFTDVDSVLAASPAYVADPKPIAELTYREMRELAYAGFTVFHDEALQPVVRAGIPVNIRNTNNPEAPGTRIVPSRPLNGQPVVGIAATDGFCSIYMSKYLMNREVGFGRRILQIIEDEGISFEHAPSGIDNMSVIIREKDFPGDVEARVVARLKAEVAVDDVFVERDIGLIMIVGEGMRHSIGITARAGAAFHRARVNIEMINQGSSEVSMMFGVKAPDMPVAVASLYDEFFD